MKLFILFFLMSTSVFAEETILSALENGDCTLTLQKKLVIPPYEVTRTVPGPGWQRIFFNVLTGNNHPGRTRVLPAGRTFKIVAGFAAYEILEHGKDHWLELTVDDDDVFSVQVRSVYSLEDLKPSEIEMISGSFVTMQCE
jgi:hypothetical protein